MNKLVWAFCGLVGLWACTGSKSQVTEDIGVEIQDSVESDTLNMDEAEDVLPARADELFNDFVFSFSADTAVQRARTFFPLPYAANGETVAIKKKDWQHDPLFSIRDYYTVIYNNEEEMQLAKDTSLIQVRLEYLDLDRNMAKRYQFKRYQGVGVWCLYGITEEPFDEGDPQDFLTFYHRFATDSIVQRESIHDPLKFVTIDPDDDFSVIETTLEKDQWFAFRPDLPGKEITNVVYGQNYQEATETKTLCIHGCENGINIILSFQKQDGKWKLVSFEDTSY